jgi:hypothetical protein
LIIYWSPSIEIGLCSIILIWLGLWNWERLTTIQPIKRSIIISCVGVVSYLLFVIAEISIINVILGSGNDSPTMQLAESFILFTIVYVLIMLSRIKFATKYSYLASILSVLILVWTVNSILFNSGFPPYDQLK